MKKALICVIATAFVLISLVIFYVWSTRLPWTGNVVEVLIPESRIDVLASSALLGGAGDVGAGFVIRIQNEETLKNFRNNLIRRCENQEPLSEIENEYTHALYDHLEWLYISHFAARCRFYKFSEYWKNKSYSICATEGRDGYFYITYWY